MWGKMRPFLKSAQTEIGSFISSIRFNISRKKPKSQGVKFMLCLLLFLLSPVTHYSQLTSHAIVDPTTFPNNKFGIHIISPTPDEVAAATSLVNSTGGVWGYVTFVIGSNDRNLDKWQTFFNELRRSHLIPIVRIATKPAGPPVGGWQRPAKEEAEKWASFLNSLRWPIKNRYVVIYNEPNHGKEWGNTTDPGSYAAVLNSTIDALKRESFDFFVLNGGLDQSTPHEPPDYFDEEKFLEEMERKVPGIFEKLDGWVSHSYPNPGFKGSPNDSGRKSIRGWKWELEFLKKLGLQKNLPVFITETGWKHAEGISQDYSLPDSEKVGENFKIAFAQVWNDPRVLAVTPFLLNYPQPPFDHFAFSDTSSKMYPQYQVVADLPKPRGEPFQHLSKNLNVNFDKLQIPELLASLVLDK